MAIQSDEIMFEGLPGGFSGAQSRYMQIHRNTAAGVPAASASNEGSIYYDTDSNIIKVSNGVSWAAIGGAGSIALTQGYTLVGGAANVAEETDIITIDTGANGNVEVSPNGTGVLVVNNGAHVFGDSYFSVQKEGAVGAIVQLINGSTTPAAQDSVGEIQFLGTDSGLASTVYTRISGSISAATAGAERGAHLFQTTVNGTLATNGIWSHDGTNAIISIGDGTSNGIVQSFGNFDLILRTGNTTTGSITIADGANGAIDIIPNGTGITTIGATNGRINLEGFTGVNGPLSINDTPIVMNANGAISTNKTMVDIDTTGGAIALTLADSAVGRVLFLRMIADGGDAVVTPDNLAGTATTITFANVGETALLHFGTGGWSVFGGTATVA